MLHLLINNPIVLKGNDTTNKFFRWKSFCRQKFSNSLATAGSGDMLCGMISGLISQGIQLKNQSLASIFLQGLKFT